MKEQNIYDNEQFFDNLVITSGINITGFICYFYEINPEKCKGFSQGTFCFPVNFIIDKKD